MGSPLYCLLVGIEPVCRKTSRLKAVGVDAYIDPKQNRGSIRRVCCKGNPKCTGAMWASPPTILTMVHSHMVGDDVLLRGKKEDPVDPPFYFY